MKVKLKLKRKHPAKAMMLNAKHKVTAIAKEFDLSEEDLALLKTKGPAAWFQVVEDKKAPAKKKVAKKKEDK